MEEKGVRRDHINEGVFINEKCSKETVVGAPINPPY